MRRFLIVLALVALVVPLANGQWWKVWSKDKKYDLGSSPTIDSYHEFNEGLGYFRIDAFDEEYSVLTVMFLTGKNTDDSGLKPDEDVKNISPCKIDEANALKWDEVCALKAKDKDGKNEYHLLFSWWYEEKKDIRVVVAEVKMTRIKLD